MKIRRRTFLGLLGASKTVLGTASEEYAAAPAYQVGVAYGSSNGYTAAKRAVSACGQWPAAQISGKVVVIKPNLVVGRPTTAGATTDPQVVRFLADASLYAGASQVLIVEMGNSPQAPVPFSACGYDLFRNYNPRVSLVDLGQQPLGLVSVPNGFTYRQLYLASLIADPNVFFISAAKMKTHGQAVVTLSTKNLVGLAPPAKYTVPGSNLPRGDLHARGVELSLVDVNLARPVNFGVIDGIWAMQGNGPTGGTAVNLNTVVAGVNPVAVDRVGVGLMGITQLVPHLNFAAFKGIGPSDLKSTKILGDAPPTWQLTMPSTPPPVLWPAVGSASIYAGQSTTISIRNMVNCSIRMEILQDNEAAPGVTLVRTLSDWTTRPQGAVSFTWDGTNDSGLPVAAGDYLVRVAARYDAASQTNYATAHLTVV